MKQVKQFAFILILGLLSCGKTERVDTQAVKEEIADREIRRISEVEIIDKALSIAKEDEKKILLCLNKSEDTAFEKFSIVSCFDKSDSIRILSGKLYLNDDTVGRNEVENGLISAYKFDSRNGQKLYSNLQDLKNDQFLYSFPVYQGDSIFSLTPSNTSGLGIVLVYYSKKEVVKSMY
jgi:hypothetical protein